MNNRVNFPVYFFIYASVVLLLFPSCSDGLSETKKKDMALNHVEMQDLQAAQRMYNQLQYYGFAPGGDSIEKFSWAHHYDAYFDTRLDSLEGNPLFASLVKCIEYAKTQPVSKRNSAIQEGNFAELLPPEIKTSSRTKLVRYPAGNVVLEMDNHFVKLMALMNFMQPALEKLLDTDMPNSQKVLAAFIDAKKDAILNGILQPFIKQVKSDMLLSVILNSENRKNHIIKQLNKTGETGLFNFPPGVKTKKDSLEFIAAHASHKEAYFTEKKKLSLLMQDALEQINSFNKKYIEEHHPVKLKHTSSFADIISRKKFDQSSISTTGADFADIVLQQSEGKFAIRLRFKTGAMNRLEIDKEIEGTDAEVFLVYSISEKNHNIPDSGKLKVKSLYAEIPTGLTIKQVTLKKTTADENNTGNIRFEYGTKNIQFKLLLPEVGIWSRFKYDAAGLKEFNEALGFSNLLGITLSEIKFNEQTWEPQLVFTWNPAGPFAQIQTDENRFQKITIALSEIASGKTENFRQAINKILVHKVCDKIKDLVKQEAGQLQQIFHCKKINYITASPISVSNDIIEGTVSAAQPQIPFLSLPGDSFHINYRFYYLNGKGSVTVEPLQLQSFIPKIRELLKSRLPGNLPEKIAALPKELLAKIKNSLSDYIPVSALYFDYSLHSLMIGVGDKLYRINNESQLGELLADAAEKYAGQLADDLKRKAGNKINETLNREIQKTVCDKISGTEVRFWGLNFKINEVSDCRVNYAKFKASFNNVIIEGEVENDMMVLTGFDADKIINELAKPILTKINLGKYVYLGQGRVVNTVILIPVWMKIPSVKYEGMITELRVTADSGVVFSDKEVLKSMSSLFTNYLRQNKNVLPLGEYAGLKVELDSVNLVQKEILLNAEAAFSDNKFVVKCRLILNFETGHTKCDILENPQEKIFSFLSNGILNILLKEKSWLKLDPITAENIKKMQITGSATLKLSGIPLPELKFTISKNAGIQTDLKPKFTLPYFPVVPPFVSLLFPSVELDVSKKSVHFSGDFAPGATSEDVLAFSYLVKVASEMDIYYAENLGKVNYKGDLILASFIQVQNGKGEISVPDKNAYMENASAGSFDNFLKFNTRTEMGQKSDNDFFAKSTGNINLLGIIQADMDLGILFDFNNKEEIHADALGRVEIPIGSLEATVGTVLSKNMLTGNVEEMAEKMAYAELKGDLKVGDFPLSSLIIKARGFNTLVSFTVMGISMSFSDAASINSITPEWIINKILETLQSIFDLTPEDLLNFLKHPEIKLLAPVGDPAENDPGVKNNKEPDLKNPPNGSNEFNKVTEQGKQGRERLEKMGIIINGAEEESEKGFAGEKEEKNLPSPEQILKNAGPITGPPPVPVIAEEPSYSCNCGNANVGFSIAKFSELNPEKTYVYVRENNGWMGEAGLVEFKERYSACNPGLLNDTYCLVYVNNSNQPEKVPEFFYKSFTYRFLEKGESMIYAFMNASEVLNNMGGYHFFPVVPPENNFYSGPGNLYTVNFKSKTEMANGVQYSLKYPGDFSYISPDGSMPFYNFIVAYNDQKAFLLTAAFNNPQNSFSAPGCGFSEVAALQAYNNGSWAKPRYFKQNIKIEYVFDFKNGSLEELNNRININSLLSENEIAVTVDSLLNSQSKQLWFYRNEDSSMQRRIMPKEETVQLINSSGQNDAGTFKSYLDFTGQIQLELSNKPELLSILSGCKEINGGGFQSKMDEIRNGPISESDIIRLVKYFNKIINGEAIISEDVCKSIQINIQGKNVQVLPVLEIINGKEAVTFYLRSDAFIQSKKIGPLFKNDLTTAFNIPFDRELVQEDFNNKPFANFIKFLQSQNSDRIFKTLLLADAGNKNIVWLKKDEGSTRSLSFATLSPDSFKISYRTPQIYFAGSSLLNTITKGDFYTRQDLFKNIPELQTALPGLINDTSIKMVLDYLHPGKPNSPVIIYKESAGSVGLWVQGNKAWLTLDKKTFSNNLMAAESGLIIKNTPSKNARITGTFTEMNISSRAALFFGGLRGVTYWHSPSGVEINPLSLFNAGFSKN